MELIDVVEEELKAKWPRLADHLERENFTVGAAFSPLFITLYIYQIEHQHAMRIFEFFILDGEDSLLRILYRLIDLKADKICELQEMALMSYLRTDLINECISEYGMVYLLDYWNYWIKIDMINYE